MAFQAKKQIFFFLLSALILWTLNRPVNANAGAHIIWDLDKHEPYILSQIAAWDITGAVSSTVYDVSCGLRFLGGPNILGQVGGFERNYINLPDHTTIYLSVSVSFIDGWSSGDTFTITAGDFTSTLGIDWINGPADCGGPESDLHTNLIIEAQHDDSTLKLAFSKQTSSPARQFAIGDVNLLLSNQIISTPLSYCFVTHLPLITISSTCSCDLGQYSDASNQCQTCDPSCYTCKGPLAKDCTSCDPRHYGGYDGEQCFKCDSSCLTCTGPGANECATCPDGEYLYPDQTCQSNCTGMSIDNYGDLSCYQKNENVPPPLSTAADIVAKVMTGGLIAVNTIDVSTPHIAIVGKLAKMFEYTRYIDVYHSSNLESFYKSHRAIPGTVVIAPSMSNQTRAKFPYGPVPAVFAEYNLHSNFIVNFWDPLITLLILSAVCLLFYGIELVAMKHITKFAQHFRRAALALITFLMGQFYSVYFDIILFSILNFRTLNANGALTWIGFLLALGFFIFVYIALILHGRLLRRYQAYKAKARDDEAKSNFETFTKNNERVSMLYKAYKDITLITHSYFWLLTSRNILCSLVIALLFAHPLAQIILIIILNVLAMVYPIYKRPFIDVFGGIQQFGYEILLFIVNVCLLILACLDADHPSTEHTGYRVGQTIIVCIFISKFMPAISIVPEIIRTLKTFYKDYQEKKNKKTPAKDSNTNKEIETVVLTLPPEGTPLSSEPDEGKKLLTHRLTSEPDIEPCESPETNKGEKVLSFPEINTEKEVSESPEMNKSEELHSRRGIKSEKQLCESPENNKVEDEELCSSPEDKELFDISYIYKIEDLISNSKMNTDKELCESPENNKIEELCSNPEEKELFEISDIKKNDEYSEMNTIRNYKNTRMVKSSSKF